MTPTKLITLSKLVELGLTANLNSAKALEPYIVDAQEFDIRPFLGEELYLDLLDDFEASPSLVDFADLFNGSEYTVNTRRRNHPGVIEVLARFVYARYIENANTHSTKHGLKVKETDWSSEPSEKTVARKIQQARSAAIVLQERVKNFLDENATDYPQWRGGKKRRRGSMRMTAVGGNSRSKKYYNPSCVDVRTVVDPACGDDYVNSGYVE